MGSWLPTPFQGRGLGQLLTQKCVEIARRWELKRMFGETTAGNNSMLRIFRRLGFEFDKPADPQIVLARLTRQP